MKCKNCGHEIRKATSIEIRALRNFLDNPVQSQNYIHIAKGLISCTSPEPSEVLK